MISICALAERVQLSVGDPARSATHEMTVEEARAVRRALDEALARVEKQRRAPATLAGLIDQLGTT